MAPSPTERFADFCASKGRKVTKQMVMVVTTAVELAGTFNHDDVLAALSGSASRATVYRTLARMVEAGILRPVRFNGRDVFVIASAEG